MFMALPPLLFAVIMPDRRGSATTLAALAPCAAVGLAGGDRAAKLR